MDNIKAAKCPNGTIIAHKFDAEKVEWIKVLARYPRIIANMIELSLGYFTPHMAVNAIKAYKRNEGFYCEWYMHIVGQRNPDKPLEDTDYDNQIKQVNHDCIVRAFRYRKDFKNRKSGRQVVEMNLKGHESVGAAWF